VVVISGTPANSTIFHAGNPLTLGASGSGGTAFAYLDNVRITKGVARYDSDSGYTPSFGTTPDPHFANVVFLSGFNGMDGSTADRESANSTRPSPFNPNATLSTEHGEIGSFPTS
jgi:hypothetical protein